VESFLPWNLIKRCSFHPFRFREKGYRVIGLGGPRLPCLTLRLRLGSEALLGFLLAPPQGRILSGRKKNPTENALFEHKKGAKISCAQHPRQLSIFFSLFFSAKRGKFSFLASVFRRAASNLSPLAAPTFSLTRR
jgi:hypothetical protein